MIEQLKKIYDKEKEENKELKIWIDKLAEFILNEHYMMTYVDERQWKNKKKEIIRKICIENNKK